MNPTEPAFDRAFPERTPGKHGVQLPKVCPLCLKIGACLRHLATAEPYSSLETRFQISKTVVRAMWLWQIPTTLVCWYDIGELAVLESISLTRSWMDCSGVMWVTHLSSWSLHLSCSFIHLTRFVYASLKSSRRTGLGLSSLNVSFVLRQANKQDIHSGKQKVLTRPELRQHLPPLHHGICF
jgi:hypothetical protein